MDVKTRRFGAGRGKGVDERVKEGGYMAVRCGGLHPAVDGNS